MSIDADLLRGLLTTVELKDQSTAAHTWRVALYTKAISEEMGHARQETDRLIRGAILHDLGKIDIPQSVLGKPGPLSDAEFAVIKRHAEIGYDRLVRMGETDEIVLDLVRSHHERLDGSGYPDGLVGDAIPAAARLFAVIDTFDAMTTVRPYRREIPADAVERAVATLTEEAGTHLDAPTVEVFCDLVRSRRVSWIQEHYNRAEDVLDIETVTSADDVRRAVESQRADGRIRIHLADFADDQPPDAPRVE